MTDLITTDQISKMISFVPSARSAIASTYKLCGLIAASTGGPQEANVWKCDVCGRPMTVGVFDSGRILCAECSSKQKPK